VLIQKQNEMLDQMTAFMSKCRIGEHKNILSFQKEICVSNISLQKVVPYLQEKYDICNISYIDIPFESGLLLINFFLLEYFFSFIRSLGVTYDHPNILDFRFCLKRYILDKHLSNLLSSKSNIEESEEIDNSSFNLNESLLITMQAQLDYKREINKELMHYYIELCVCENNCISFKPCSFTSTYEEEQLLLSLDKLE